MKKCVVLRAATVVGAVSFLSLMGCFVFTGCGIPDKQVDKSDPHPDKSVIRGPEISYSQIGVCNGTRDGDNMISAGPGQVYAMFWIEGISNSRSAFAVNFDFDPSKLIIKGTSPPGSRSLQMQSTLTSLGVDVHWAQPLTVGAGKDIQMWAPGQAGLGCIALVATGGLSQQFELAYDDSNSSMVVKLTKSQGRAAPITEDCRAIRYKP